LKVQYIQKVNGGGGVVFATGTPIANSVAEMFTMQRYLQMGTLNKQKLHHFDSWAATFGEPVTAMELAPDGAGYRLNTRFARFINVPELMQMFCQVADIQTADKLKLPIPEMQTGKPMIVRAPSTPELKEIVKGLVARAEAIRSGRIPPQEDNMLKITSEGRKAALDLRVLNPRAKDQPESKINLAADRIFEIWKDTHENRCAQMVFCDLSTPSKVNRQFCAYDDLKTKLVGRGIPAEQIAFMQDFDSDVQKHILFRDVRSGKIRILMGSTMKMGAGTNVQERLVALHHLDAPWRPADVEQREGRILRQGNLNKTVQIYRYVTEGIRRLKEAIPMLNERIENLKLDMAQRTDTRGDAFQIVLEKSVVKDRAIAGELLSRITRRVANANNQFEIGSFGGFQLFARSSLWGKVELVLNGKNHYALNVAETPLGMIRSLEYLVQNLEERMAYNQRDLADSEKKCGELETKIGQPFEHMAKLQSLAQRQQQLEDALDITKNQAANSLSTEEAGQTTEEETEAIQKTVRQSHAKTATTKSAAKMRVAVAH
jgi:hypothetical protein